MLSKHYRCLADTMLIPNTWMLPVTLYQSFLMVGQLRVIETVNTSYQPYHERCILHEVGTNFFNVLL
jgi:hypothetical protein